MNLRFGNILFGKALLLLLPVLLTGCSSMDIRDIHAIARAEDPARQVAQLLDKKGRYYAAHPQQLTADIKAFKTKIDKFKRLVSALWGEDDARESGPKDYVKYTDKYYNRAHINFETGIVTVETIAPDSQQEYLKKAIVTTLLTPDDPRQVDLYSDEAPTPGSKSKPFLYEQVLDHDGKPVAWPWRANRYAEYLIKNRLTKINIGRRHGLRVEFPMVAAHQQLRAYKYASLVQKYSNKYNVTESLIYGIIKTESSFNPFAVSHAPAYGLMQIVPATAGQDVFDKIKQRPGQPSPQYLYDPENNIDTGTAYLKLLQERYLVKIKDHNALRYSVISAYNGGAGNVFKTFSGDRNTAVKKINRLSASQVYQQLTNKHPSQESRRYLYKVNQAQKEFWKNNGFSQAQ
ncbi:MAG: membrane-bound lytic murein transglycosylase MltC [Proteobacteria bacterium]|nr:membrane-bound lytic murein transglycosylase MltC [Pseudomonadota bacterium]